MMKTMQIPGPIKPSETTYSGGAAFAAFLGWSLFFLVPVLYLAAWQESASGPNDNSANVFSITAVLAFISVASACVGAIRGRDATRNACLVLLALELLPLVGRSGLF